MSKYIDLHLHSFISDGSLSPRQIIARSKEIELSCIALTDHDTMDGVDEAITTAYEYSIDFIPGVEMSCVFKDKEIHILGYIPSIDCYKAHSDKIKDTLKAFADERMERNKKILSNLQKDGIEIEFEELYKYSKQAKITRAHFANVLVEKAYVKDKKEAFDKYLFTGSKYCPKKTTGIDKIMDFFNEFSFFSSLAHPFIYGFSEPELWELIKELKLKGLNAIEAYHSTHSQYDTSRLLSIARKNDLLITGGSDFHGENKPGLKIGIGYGGLKIPEILLKDIKAYSIIS